MGDSLTNEAIEKKPNSFKAECGVILVVVCFIFILESVARYLAPNLDSASEHIFEIPSIVDSIEIANEENKVLIFGNSLMKHGIDMDLLRAEVGNEDSIFIAKVAPVGTSIVDWTYLYKRYFENSETHPDKIFVGFVGHHVADPAQAYPIRNRRLGRHFLAQEDQWEFGKDELPEIHDRMQTGISHYSALFGDQPEHQYWLYRAIIPHYGSGLSLNKNWVEQWQKQRADLESLKFEEQGVNFHRVERFLTLMRKHQVQVCFIPMPQPDFYELDENLQKIVISNGAIWLDARNVCIGDEYYSDGYHLGELGKPIFSQWLAKNIK